jgi:hypothetical protein
VRRSQRLIAGICGPFGPEPPDTASAKWIFGRVPHSWRAGVGYGVGRWLSSGFYGFPGPVLDTDSPDSLGTVFMVKADWASHRLSARLLPFGKRLAKPAGEPQPAFGATNTVPPNQPKRPTQHRTRG